MERVGRLRLATRGAAWRSPERVGRDLALVAGVVLQIISLETSSILSVCAAGEASGQRDYCGKGSASESPNNEDIDSTSMKTEMAQLTVRNIADHLVAVLKQRAGAHGRSAEAEHREILRRALVEGESDFAGRARRLRHRLCSRTDSSELIRADRDRDTAQ